MSRVVQIDIVGFGARLKQERERLGLTMSEFGALGDVNRMTQMRYETGTSSPTIVYLQKIGTQGVDAVFVATGVGSSSLIPIQDAIAFSQALDLVDQLATQHNFKPPPEFRMRAVAQVYAQILRFGVKKVHPSLEDLLKAVQTA